MKYESFFLHWCECINEAVSPDDRCRRKERSRLLWLKKGSLKLLRTRAGVPAFSSLCNRLRGVVYSDIKSLIGFRIFIVYRSLIDAGGPHETTPFWPGPALFAGRNLASVAQIAQTLESETFDILFSAGICELFKSRSYSHPCAGRIFFRALALTL